MANWDEIKLEYETTKITLAKLAEKHDVPLGTIKSQKSRDTKNGNPWARDATAKKDATKKKKVATIKEDASKDEIIRFTDGEENGLNDKQSLFIAYYVKCWNATKAYQKAYPGCAYSTARSEGARLLANPSIREEITRVRDGLTQDALLDKRTLIQKWIDIAFADITDYLKFGRQEEVEYQEDGQPAIDMNGNVKTYAFNYIHLNESSEIDGSLVTEVKQGKDGISVKLADKMKALEFLSKHMDLLNESELKRLKEEKAKADIAKVRSETKGNGIATVKSVDLSNLTTEELRALASRNKR